MLRSLFIMLMNAKPVIFSIITHNVLTSKVCTKTMKQLWKGTQKRYLLLPMHILVTGNFQQKKSLLEGQDIYIIDIDN